MTYFEALTSLIARGEPFVAVTIVDTAGSTPQERGSKMLVTREGRSFGTVGGGRVEVRALEEAARLLGDYTAPKTRFFQWNLNNDIGMTCGGTVRIYFEAFNVTRWNVVIFGAGHVAASIARLLVDLDCRITVIDPREEWLARLPQSPKLTGVRADDMSAEVAKLPEGSFVLLITMGHASDVPILTEILRTRSFPYVGVIGSNAKAKRLRAELAEAGIDEERQRSFFCPIGLPFGSDAPAEIAISAVAQLLQIRDSLS